MRCWKGSCRNDLVDEVHGQWTLFDWLNYETCCQHCQEGMEIRAVQRIDDRRRRRLVFTLGRAGALVGRGRLLNSPAGARVRLELLQLAAARRRQARAYCLRRRWTSGMPSIDTSCSGVK